jgi:hypothetical protein
MYAIDNHRIAILGGRTQKGDAIALRTTSVTVSHVFNDTLNKIPWRYNLVQCRIIVTRAGILNLMEYASEIQLN